ncbi:transcription termination factor MTERF5, chloroplastic [Beta vulgaris subsp. vulgaris]|uniref:transcription termination factor MTERF5, chloroplastic n=1 Tax=Beta vulgaris subsp. vulgaris TaxID=3555 RepID=UPI002036FEF8|nr:transcription termination factor MTERF5, chloroplastic [Beta vulgaris subsp. vulgaris]XP_010694648.2 transcription termination factor MTERF5, chloroplastic [Beta vulgaris subsp. vulgaris]XP_010694649.2 transcription termination factor MTERF5, chloroplastic [Beta vulgaris subsp. vulgaris]
MANFLLRRLVFSLQKRFFSAPTTSKSTSIRTTSKPIKNSSTLDNTPSKTSFKSTINDVSSSVPPSFSIQYLTNSCGLSLNSAISTAKKITLEEKNKEHFDSVISFLKSHEFSDTQITELVQKYPAVLQCRILTNLKPKIEFLIENGIQGSNVPKLIISTPAIFFRSLDAQLKPAMALIKRVLTSPDKLLVVARRGSWILTTDWKSWHKNLDYLIELGVPKRRVQELLVLQPRCLYQDIERIKYGVEMVKNMGVKPDDVKFIHTFRVISSLSELGWKRKVKVFESLGWNSGEVVSTFTKSPHCLSCSEEKLRNAMDYFVNTVKVDRRTIINYPKILMYSIQKRVIPRYTVWKILEERKLIRRSQFIWVLNKSESDFIEQYVTRYSDLIPHLRSIYLSCKEDSITPTSS